MPTGRGRKPLYCDEHKSRKPVASVGERVGLCRLCRAPVERKVLRGRLPKYCSVYCKDKAAKRTKPDIPRKQKPRPKIPLQPIQCPGCKVEFTPNRKNHRYCKRYCSIRLKELRKPRDEVRQYTCAHCSKTFGSAEMRHTYCSKRCKVDAWEAANPEAAKALARIHGAKRQARMKGADAENVDPFKVFERDRWRCHLCGIRTPKSARGTYQDNAPELDHLQPLSRGGQHTYANTACCCRRCNIAKGAKPLGQLLLIG